MSLSREEKRDLPASSIDIALIIVFSCIPLAALLFLIGGFIYWRAGYKKKGLTIIRISGALVSAGVGVVLIANKQADIGWTVLFVTGAVFIWWSWLAASAGTDRKTYLFEEKLQMAVLIARKELKVEDVSAFFELIVDEKVRSNIFNMNETSKLSPHEMAFHLFIQTAVMAFLSEAQEDLEQQQSTLFEDGLGDAIKKRRRQSMVNGGRQWKRWKNDGLVGKDGMNFVMGVFSNSKDLQQKAAFQNVYLLLVEGFQQQADEEERQKKRIELSP